MTGGSIVEMLPVTQMKVVFFVVFVGIIHFFDFNCGSEPFPIIVRKVPLLRFTGEPKTGSVNVFCSVTAPFFKVALLFKQVGNSAFNITPCYRLVIPKVTVFNEKSFYLLIYRLAGILTN